MDGATYQISVVHLDERADLRLVGEFDLAAADDLRRELLDRVRSLPVLVDMRDATFVDSSALGVFLQAARSADENGTAFRLVNVQASVRRILEISGTLDILTDQNTADA